MKLSHGWKAKLTDPNRAKLTKRTNNGTPAGYLKTVYFEFRQEGKAVSLTEIYKDGTAKAGSWGVVPPEAMEELREHCEDRWGHV